MEEKIEKLPELRTCFVLEWDKGKAVRDNLKDITFLLRCLRLYEDRKDFKIYRSIEISCNALYRKREDEAKYTGAEMEKIRIIEDEMNMVKLDNLVG